MGERKTWQTSNYPRFFLQKYWTEIGHLCNRFFCPHVIYAFFDEKQSWLSVFSSTFFKQSDFDSFYRLTTAYSNIATVCRIVCVTPLKSYPVREYCKNIKEWKSFTCWLVCSRSTPLGPTLCTLLHTSSHTSLCNSLHKLPCTPLCTPPCPLYLFIQPSVDTSNTGWIPIQMNWPNEPAVN